MVPSPVGRDAQRSITQLVLRKMQPHEEERASDQPRDRSRRWPRIEGGDQAKDWK